MPKPVTAVGKLRHRVQLQRPAATSDGQGGQTIVWTVVASIWAEVVPVRAWETNFSSAVQYRRTHTMTIRWNDSIDTTQRVVFGSQTFQVKGIRPKDNRRFWQVCDLEENVGT